MRWAPRQQALPGLGAVSFGLTFWAAWTGSYAPYLTVLPVVWYVLWDEVWFRSRSANLVYLLRDRDGAALYVGSTEDIADRMAWHVAPSQATLEPWRERIDAVSVMRWCRTRRQAYRVEKRMIGALTVATGNGWCPELQNDQWAAPARGPVRLWLLGWSWVYLCVSCLWEDRVWHRPSLSGWVIPRRDVSDGDWWEDVPEASRSTHYERHAHVTERHALPAHSVTLTEGLPLRGNPRDATDEGTVLTIDRSEDDVSDDAGHGRTDADRAARKRIQDAKRAKAYRARKKARGS